MIYSVVFFMLTELFSSITSALQVLKVVSQLAYEIFHESFSAKIAPFDVCLP